MEQGVKENELIKKYNITQASLRTLQEKITNTDNNEAKETKQPLNKLVLNISNLCNLRCRYCYANGGSYQSDESLMDKKTAKKALDLFYERYRDISMIQLFGGEPFLNMEVFKYVCHYVASKGKNTKIGVVTNGTIMSEEIAELVEQYNLIVTISYDGIPQVNDTMRITKDGKGTSNLILDNIKFLYKRTGQPSTIEVTYNQAHVDLGISISDIIKFLRDEVGEIPLHIVPAGGDPSCDFVLKNRQEFVDSVDDLFCNNNKSKMFTYSLVQRIIAALYTKKTGGFLCGAGLNTYSISVKGDVFPCFMFTDDNSLNMGNIYDEELFSSEKFKHMIDRLRNFNKTNIVECKKCFIQKSCNGCLGMNLLETGDVFSLSEETCAMYRAMTEKVIYNLYRIKKGMINCETGGFSFSPAFGERY